MISRPKVNLGEVRFFNSWSSVGAILYDALYIEAVLGTSSIGKSTPLDGGNPDFSSGNMFGNSHTTGISSSFFGGFFSEIKAK